MQSYADHQTDKQQANTESLRSTLNRHSQKDHFAQDITAANIAVIKVISALEIDYYSGDRNKQKSPQEEWRQMADKHCQKWSRAEHKLSKTKSELETLSSPEQGPLGIIGRSLDSAVLEQAQQCYNLALAEFTLLDEDLRKDDGLSQNFETAIRKHNLEQSNLTQLQGLKKQALMQQRYIPELLTKAELPVSQDVPEVPQAISLCSSNDIGQIKAVIQLTEHVLRLTSPTYQALQQKEIQKKSPQSSNFFGKFFKK